MALLITITNAGRAEMINAENTGTGPVVITQIGFGTGQYSPSKAQTALTNQVKRVNSIAGLVVANDTIHVMAKDEGPDTYNVGEFGLFSASGNLVAVYSQVAASGWIIQKSGASTLLLAVDIILESLSATNLTFGDVTFINPPATTEKPGVVQLEDSLTSSSTSKALTAKQGKTLQDSKQPLDATLTALAELATAADKMIYATGTDTFGMTDLSAFIRTLLDDVNATAALATLGAAPLKSPGLTGSPTAPTAAQATNNTQLATTAFVKAAIAALIDSSPASLDNLNKLAAALGDDPNFATTITNAIDLKANLATTLAGYGITDGLKIGQVGLAANSAPAIQDFKAYTAGGIYQAIGGTVQGSSTPNSPAGSNYNLLGVLAVCPRGDATYYLAFENGGGSSLRRFWVGQYNSGQLFWSRLMSSDDEASKSEAQEGSLLGKWMSPLRVFEAMRSAAAAATEVLRGVLRIGTQAEVDAGTLDDVAVTPKKLRWGASFLISANGHVSLPMWLGGLIVQWGTAAITTTSLGGSSTVSLARSYPNSHFGAVGNYKKNSMINDAFSVNAFPTSLSTVTLVLDAATASGTPTGAQEVFYISIGN